jgi:hypothetical protein
MATDTLDNDIYSLIAKYGFKRLHSRLVEIMKDEYTYLHSQFQVPATVSTQTPAIVVPVTVAAVQPVVDKKKVRKQRVKKVTVPVESIVPGLVPEVPFTSGEQVSPEIKEIVLVPPQDRTGFRDPKEVKEYQKKAEESKRRENDALGIQVHAILTKENLVKWVEEEGHTYAWVAREKAGCADTQVAATAQMMGIKSKISKKRGMIMSGN